MRKKLLILGGSRYVIPAIEAAHRLGVYVITCDYLPNNIAHKFSDEYYNISIIDKEAVLMLAKKLKIDGIISFATDPGVVVAAYVAEKLGLPTSPYNSVKILQNKNLFRNFLKKNNFNTPKYKYFNEKDRISIDDFKYPFIVKPVDSAGSKGVTKVESEQDLQDAVKIAFSYSLNKKIIIEEFIQQQGCSSDTDCFSVDGELVFISFNCQYFDKNAANPYTPAYYVWPSNMPPRAIEILKIELQRLVTLLNLKTSIYNIETRLGVNGKVYIMEVSPRAGGNRLSEVLKMACGQDLITSNIKAALGMKIDTLRNPQYESYYAEYILHSNKNGKFKGIWIDRNVEKNNLVQKDLWVQEGDLVHTFTGANETIGTLILKFTSFEIANKILVNNKKWLKILVE